MLESLKDANRIPLLTAAASNAALFYIAIQTDALLAGDWLQLAKGWLAVLPAGAALILVGILNAQLDSTNKARLVFWRWHNPLPGSAAFTKHGPRDERVDMAALKLAHGPLPEKPADQNRLWYRLYKTVENDPSVSQVHREFLFARDFACMAALMLVTLGCCGLFLIPSWKTAIAYLLILAIEYLVALRAARVHGSRFVTTVLALKGAGK